MIFGTYITEYFLQIGYHSRRIFRPLEGVMVCPMSGAILSVLVSD